MKTSRLIASGLWLTQAQWSPVAADQVVFNDAISDSQSSSAVKNVAIIGAGSAGSSTAYFLNRFSREQGIPVNITVFERDGHVGGRSTTVGVYDDEENPAELGASIFVKVNQILVNASTEFNLSASGIRDFQIEGPVLGIWNGKEFVYSQTSGGGWWDTARLFWKYGLAPLRTVNLMKATVGNFLKMYEAPHFPWASLSDVAYGLGLTAATSSTGEQFLKENGIGEAFANDIVQASTRVNYAQNLPVIHGLEAMVCMATDGAMSIEGGNWRIFANMLKASEATVRLNTTVSRLTKLEDASYGVVTKSTHQEDAMEHQNFDEVVLAGPYQFSDIKIGAEPEHVPDAIPYVELHVTLFTSKHLLSPQAFGLPPDKPVPQVVLTTLQPGEHHGSTPNGVGSAGFFSISLLQPTVDTRDGKHELEYLYKIFSHTPVNNTFLTHILGLEDTEHISDEDVSWTYRKVWNSYPYEYPRVTFEELRLDERLWYTSGIESFISTMETSALMGMNVAKLIVERWEKEEAEKDVYSGYEGVQFLDEL